VLPIAVLLWPRPAAAAVLSAAAAACWGIWMGSSAGATKWRKELALAGFCALAFVSYYGSWGAWFGFFVAAALAGAQGHWKSQRAIWVVLVVATLVWAVMRHWGPANS